VTILFYYSGNAIIPNLGFLFTVIPINEDTYCKLPYTYPLVPSKGSIYI